MPSILIQHMLKGKGYQAEANRRSSGRDRRLTMQANQKTKRQVGENLSHRAQKIQVKEKHTPIPDQSMTAFKPKKFVRGYS